MHIHSVEFSRIMHIGELAFIRHQPIWNRGLSWYKVCAQGKHPLSKCLFFWLLDDNSLPGAAVAPNFGNDNCTRDHDDKSFARKIPESGLNSYVLAQNLRTKSSILLC